MRIGKKFNKRSVQAFSAGLFISLFLLSSAQSAVAWTVQGYWKDRAHIEITKVEFDDGADNESLGYNLSDETSEIMKFAEDDGKDGNTELRRLTNKDSRGDYYDDDIANAEFFYKKAGCSELGNMIIDGESKEKLQDKPAYLVKDLQIISDYTGRKWFNECVRFADNSNMSGDGKAYFSIDNPDDLRNAWFKVIDNKTLERVDGRDGKFQVIEGKDTNFFYASTGARCDDGLYQRVILDANASGNVVGGKYETCQESGPFGGMFDIKIKDANNLSIVGTPAGPNNPPGTGEITENEPRCETGGLSWAICPVINALAEGSDLIFENFIKPALQTDSIDLDSQDDTNYIYQAWSNVRIYGNILLVIGMLVIVFGQSIGGGLIDAYTAKKVLPRILAAAIMINLSIYIVAILIDITNILGNGINTLLTGLITTQETGMINLKVDGGASILGIGAIAGAGSAVWLLGATLVQPFLLFVLLPLFLALVGVIVTLILRRGLIMLLIITAPIAFALYCLPNTEQYFKKWWDLLFKALLVYPIIGAVFGVANLLAVTINQANQTSNKAATAVAQLISIVVLVIPLFLIPYSFKLAGGLISSIHGTLTGIGKKAHEGVLGNANDPNSARNRSKRKMGERFTRRRERAYDAVGQAQMNKHVVGKRGLTRGLGLIGAGIGAGDLEARRSALNKQEGELRELKTNYGPDASVRALFATKQADGRWKSEVSGKEYAEQDVMKARSLYGKDLSAIQTAINYEVGKAGNDGEYQKFLDHSPVLMDSFKFNEDEVNSAMKGVGYNNASKRLDLKHTSFKKNDDGTWSRKLDVSKFTQDAAENFGSYPIANMKTSPIEALSHSFDAAKTAIDTGQLEGTLKDGRTYKFESQQEAQIAFDDVTSTAKTLDTRMRRGDFSQVGQTEDGQPLSAGASGGPGRVNDAIQNLVGKVLPHAPPAAPPSAPPPTSNHPNATGYM